MPASRTLEALSGPLALRHRSLLWQAGAVVLGTLLLALSSRIEVPMLPVPMTMQSFAVTLVGALFGARLGAITVIAWLAEALAGLPVLAVTAGVQAFVGPTAGYLFAFPLAAGLVGWLVARGWNGNRVGLALLAMLAGNAVCLTLGAGWLSVMVGWDRAIVLGVTPFLLGGVLKSILGAATLKVLSSKR